MQFQYQVTMEMRPCVYENALIIVQKMNTCMGREKAGTFCCQKKTTVMHGKDASILKLVSYGEER